MPARSTQTTSKAAAEEAPEPEHAPRSRAPRSPRTAKSAPADKGAAKAGGADPSAEKPTRAAANRSLWKGAISFGLVTIPVRLLAATTSKDLSFHLLHEKCHSRLKQVRWCPTCDREVGWDETVRGYEYAKDHYVVLTDEDFEQIPRPSKHTIELSAFVDMKQIDPVYYEKSYYLDPEPAGAKSYALLLTALEQKNLTAVARIAIRERERLCALRPANGVLVLETLYYADELREHQAAPDAQVSQRELDMALKLIEFLTEDFEPQKYHDEYREAVLELIEAKTQGAQIVRQPAEPNNKVIDLMDALRASLAAAQSQKQEPKEAAPAEPAERKRPRRSA